jgi:hypothetical protein
MDPIRGDSIDVADPMEAVALRAIAAYRAAEAELEQLRAQAGKTRAPLDRRALELANLARRQKRQLKVSEAERKRAEAKAKALARQVRALEASLERAGRELAAGDRAPAKRRKRLKRRVDDRPRTLRDIERNLGRIGWELGQADADRGRNGQAATR